MYDLVEHIERYPEFLPWCSGTEVVRHDGNITIASIEVAYRGLHHRFTTENTNEPGAMIDIDLKDGPFRHLDGRWRFIPLSEDACKIEFELSYDFSSSVLEKIIGPIFHPIANGMMDAFVRRADKLYSAAS
jgi:ribosome-associated toxin RatA of RatAB toxin-antitoxin module